MYIVYKTLFFVLFQNQAFVSKLVLTCTTSSWDWEPNLILTDYSCKHSKLAKTSGPNITLYQTYIVERSPQLPDGSRILLTVLFTFFSYFTFPGAPYRIILLYLPRLPCYFFLFCILTLVLYNVCFI